MIFNHGLDSIRDFNIYFMTDLTHRVILVYDLTKRCTV